MCIGNINGKTERNETHGKDRRRCEDNIKLNLKVMGYEYVKWTRMAQETEKWAGSFNHGNGTSGFVNGEDCLHWLSKFLQDTLT
jgi:hypothetical protein